VATIPPSALAFARVQRALAFLRNHPHGLPLRLLAEQLDLPEDRLRKDLISFYSADIPPQALLGLQRPDSIQFLAADGAEDEPKDAVLVQLVSARPETELGVEYLRADELAELYQVATSLRETEPSNAILSQAIGTLEEQFLGLGHASTAEAPLGTDPANIESTVELLRRAVDGRFLIRIEYSRAWEPGVFERDIEPYALKRTTRGWELDAGPLLDGKARTYIVNRIRSVVVTEERFETPAGIAGLLADERREEVVDLSLPQRTQWAADRFAERTEVLESDRSDVALRAWFLPPVSERVGLVLTIAGPDAFVIEPASLGDEGSKMATRLLRHHGLE
jgi:proteasome accessory factor C